MKTESNKRVLFAFNSINRTAYLFTTEATGCSKVRNSMRAMARGLKVNPDGFDWLEIEVVKDNKEYFNNYLLLNKQPQHIEILKDILKTPEDKLLDALTGKESLYIMDYKQALKSDYKEFVIDEYEVQYERDE